jgi:NAD(P)H-dependent flavin oxidoreductase YrpB (nitropropane dioxygenase family)
MVGWATPTLASAVSNAGALGSIGMVHFGIGWLYGYASYYLFGSGS